MNVADFTANAPGSFVPTISDQQAFVPDPLPPKFDLGRIALQLADAMQAIGELKGACRRLSSPFILVGPLQRNEALTSSAMEGTFTTEDNLLLIEAGVKREADESTREVSNYIRALSASLAMIQTIPISHRLIRRAHEILLSGLSQSRGAQKRPGEYKQEQNWIGGRTIEAARYVPPPPQHALTAMDALEAYVNRDDRKFPTPLIDLALVHYQLEAIHPFADGNGRVGRMLISLMAVHSGLLEVPVLYLSPVLERHKDQYIDLMFSVSAMGHWEAWLNFFFDRIVESCMETVDTVDRLISLQTEYRRKVTASTRSSNPLELADGLFERQVITVNEAAAKLNVTYAGARHSINKLIELDILKEIPGTYPMAFYAPQIVTAARPVERTAPKAQARDLFT